MCDDLACQLQFEAGCTQPPAICGVVLSEVALPGGLGKNRASWMIRHNSDYVDECDRDLERRVLNYLVGRQMPSLRNIEVTAQGGSVVLRGQVQSFYQKQLCLNCCRRVAGVHEVIDQVDVATREPEWWLV